MDGKQSGRRQGYDQRERVIVGSEEEFYDTFAPNLSERGLFIRKDMPPAANAQVLIEFALKNGAVLARVAGKVVHSKPAMRAGEATAGMGLELTGFDEKAKKIVAHYRQNVAEVTPTDDDSPQVELLTSPRSAGSANEPILGIDLGTTNSCVAIVENGEPRILVSREGHETLPSIVFLTDDQKVLVGQPAADKMVLEPSKAIYGSKRFIGRPFESKEVKTFGHFFNYQLTLGKGGRVAAKMAKYVVPLEVASSYVLAYVRMVAQNQLNRNVTRAVITVPAYFGESQRQCVRDAGKLAGLEVERILSEPTAAAVAYGYKRGLKHTILVYDLGGGTFDASVLRIDGDKMEVLATGGDAFLGGSDFDDRITEFALMTIERMHKINLRDDPVAVQRVRQAAEAAKRQLSDANEATIDLPYLGRSIGGDGSINAQVSLEREMFERLTTDLVDRTMAIVQSVLDRAKMTSKGLDDVILVGGQSRSPCIRRALSERFGRRPGQSVHPDHAVATGAALVAAAMSEQSSIELTDILPAAIRLGLAGGSTRELLPRGQSLPAEAEFEVYTDANNEFRAKLYRGDAERADENEPLGEVRVSSSDTLAMMDAAATATAKISDDGILTITVQHPTTKNVEELTLSLLGDSTEPEVMDVDDLDIVEA